MWGATIRCLAIKAAWYICLNNETFLLIVCSRFCGRTLWNFWVCVSWQLFSDGEFLDFSGFEKFPFHLVWELFVWYFRFTCACVHVYVREWASIRWHIVRAYVHMRRGMSDLGPSIICFPDTNLLQPILSQRWVETPELLGRISDSELDPQPWHFTNNRIFFPSPDNSLGWTLYRPSTPHFTRAADLPNPLPKRVCSSAGRALAQHRLTPRWLHP